MLDIWIESWIIVLFSSELIHLRKQHFRGHTLVFCIFLLPRVYNIQLYPVAKVLMGIVIMLKFIFHPFAIGEFFIFVQSGFAFLQHILFLHAFIRKNISLVNNFNMVLLIRLLRRFHLFSATYVPIIFFCFLFFVKGSGGRQESTPAPA